MRLEEIIADMLAKVDQFQREITKVPYTEGCLMEKSRYGHLIEELKEIIECHENGDVAGVIDGHIDLVYVALGSLLQMGIYPSHAFNIVHEANMRKIGRKTERHDFDAVKPAGWEPPNFDNMLEHLEVLHQVSPVFVELTKLRMKKGNNYNRGNVKRGDHFPMGDLSFFQMTWIKMCRIRSLTENPDDNSRRLLEREINDLIVYSCFWAEFIQGLELDK